MRITGSVAVLLLYLTLQGAGQTSPHQQLAERRLKQQLVSLDRDAKEFSKSVAKAVGAPDVAGGTGAVVEQEVDHLQTAIANLRTVPDDRLAPSLTEVLRRATNVECLLLHNDFSARVVIDWARLHGDLESLACSQRMSWVDTSIDAEFVAELVARQEQFRRDVESVLGQPLFVKADGRADFQGLWQEFAAASNRLASDYRDKQTFLQAAQAASRYARAIDGYLTNHSLPSALRQQWRSLSSELQEILRLYDLDLRYQNGCDSRAERNQLGR